MTEQPPQAKYVVAPDYNVSVCVAATNEPNLKGTLEAWANQSFKNFNIHVALDCPNDESIATATAFVKADDRFSLSVSPVLRGLRRIWNEALLSGSEVVFLAGGDCTPDKDYVAAAHAVLTKHPEYGYVMPTKWGRILDAPLWMYAITKGCIAKTGLLSDEFGIGGLGMVRDYYVRAYDAGYRPQLLRDVKYRLDHEFSIMASSPDLSLFEGTTRFKEKYGFDIVGSMHKHIRPSPEFVDNQGDKVAKHVPHVMETPAELQKTLDDMQFEIDTHSAPYKALPTRPNKEAIPLLEQLDKEAVIGASAAYLLLGYWAQQKHREDYNVEEEMSSIMGALNMVTRLLVNQRLILKRHKENVGES